MRHVLRPRFPASLLPSHRPARIYKNVARLPLRWRGAPCVALFPAEAKNKPKLEGFFSASTGCSPTFSFRFLRFGFNDSRQLYIAVTDTRALRDGQEKRPGVGVRVRSHLKVSQPLMSEREHVTVGDQQKRALNSPLGSSPLSLYCPLALACLSSRALLGCHWPFCQCLEGEHTLAVRRLGNVWQYGRWGQK